MVKIDSIKIGKAKCIYTRGIYHGDGTSGEIAILICVNK